MNPVFKAIILINFILVNADHKKVKVYESWCPRPAAMPPFMFVPAFRPEILPAEPSIVPNIPPPTVVPSIPPTVLPVIPSNLLPSIPLISILPAIIPTETAITAEPITEKPITVPAEPAVCPICPAFGFEITAEEYNQQVLRQPGPSDGICLNDGVKMIYRGSGSLAKCCCI